MTFEFSTIIISIDTLNDPVEVEIPTSYQQNCVTYEVKNMQISGLAKVGVSSMKLYMRKEASDPAKAKLLWELTEKLIKQVK